MRLFLHLIRTLFRVFLDVLTFIHLCLQSTAAVAAENLFVRKQLGRYVERKVKPRRATDGIRFSLGRLSRFFDWRNALTIVKPDTLVRWHRKGFRLFWKWKSRPRGKPCVPAQLRKLIVEMATHKEVSACGPGEMVRGLSQPKQLRRKSKVVSLTQWAEKRQHWLKPVGFGDDPLQSCPSEDAFSKSYLSVFDPADDRASLNS